MIRFHQPGLFDRSARHRTALELPAPPEWTEAALCAQTDPDAFFPDKGGSTREAKQVCIGCPVRSECLRYALEHDERWGIWGGLSERQRRVVKQTGEIPPDVSPRSAAIAERDQAIWALLRQGIQRREITVRLGVTNGAVDGARSRMLRGEAA